MSSTAEQDLIDRFAPKPPPAVARVIAAADAEHRAYLTRGDDTTVVPPANEPVQQTLPMEMPVQPASAPAPAPRHDDADARYRTLQGKYDSETASLRGQVRTLETMVGNLQNLIATMQTPTPTAAPASAPSETKFDLTADQAEYGELVEKAQNWAKAAMQREIDELKAQVRQVSGQTEAQVQATNETRCQQALDTWAAGANVNWRVINDDPAFLSWLERKDAFSGNVRGAMLRQAYVGGASDRVVHFFDAFVKETAALTQQPRQEPAPSAQRQPRIPLETLAAPGRGGSSATPPTPTKRIWTSQQVRAFYNEKVRGAYRGREAEAQRLENDLHAAIAEGRYRE